MRGRRKWCLAPLDFENFSKKGCFLNFEWEKPNFTTFAPPGKNLEKSPCTSSGKNPFDAHACMVFSFTLKTGNQREDLMYPDWFAIHVQFPG